MRRSLKRELVRAQEEIKRIQSVPLVIGQFMEAIDQKYFRDIIEGSCNSNREAALVSYSLLPDRIMSFAFFLHWIVRSSNLPHPSLSIATQTPLLTSFLLRLILLLLCLVPMRNPM